MKQMNAQFRYKEVAATVFAHVLFIVIIFVLPELVMNIARPNRSLLGFYPGFYVKTLLFIAVFYVNYFIIIDRTLRSGKRRILRFILWNIALLAVAVWIDYISSSIWFPWHRRNHAEPGTLASMLKYASFLTRDCAMMVLTVGLAVALRLSMKWKEMEQQRRDLLASQRATELDNLKNQLNPHFLFNTLNTIYALVDLEPELAKKAIHRLSGLLRYMLYESEEKVQLKEEIGFIEDYVQLMRLRMADRKLEFSVSIEGFEDLAVPPLLFIPLVENAFKYGNESDKSIPIVISIAVDSNMLKCTTSNGLGVFSNGDKSSTSGGIGLANLRRRLALLFGNKASLRTSIEHHIFSTCLILPLCNQN